MLLDHLMKLFQIQRSFSIGCKSKNIINAEYVSIWKVVFVDYLPVAYRG